MINNNDEMQRIQAQQANVDFMRQRHHAQEPASPAVGITESNISEVMERTGCERNQAIRALFMTDDDVHEAVRQQRGLDSNRIRFNKKTCHAAEMYILKTAKA